MLNQGTSLSPYKNDRYHPYLGCVKKFWFNQLIRKFDDLTKKIRYPIRFLRSQIFGSNFIPFKMRYGSTPEN